MKTRSFYNIDHAFSYLTNSIIRVAEKPIFIKEVSAGDDGFILRYFHLDDGRQTNHYILHNAPEVDMEPVTLGLLSIDDKSAYVDTLMCYRAPRRAWKIGLNSENLFLKWANDERHPVLDPYAVIRSKELGRTITGTYPTYEAALELIGKKNRLVAFSRRFAVNSDGIFCKDMQAPVGLAHKDKPELLPEFDFLQQSLDEDFHA